MRFSGCANCCGQHPLADLGFYGKVGRKGQHPYPAYRIVAGARLDPDNGTEMSRNVDEINARDLPQFVTELLEHYIERASMYPSFRSYLDREGEPRIHALCDRFRSIPPLEENEHYYCDWGADTRFSLAQRRSGECASGLFDLIDIDMHRINTLRAKIAQGCEPGSALPIRELVHTAFRALLITRGIEAHSDDTVAHHFLHEFIDRGLIPDRFRETVRAYLSNKIPPENYRNEALELSKEIERLYETLDDTLQFHPDSLTGFDETHPDDPDVAATKDFRGVACPMNFVKTKMALSNLTTGERLQVLLDDGEPAENVPRSVEAEGHRVIQKQKTDGFWRITIQKRN
jgi:sulfite reductase (ferredoxin)